MPNNLAYQEQPREELIGGKVVMMSPRPTVNHNQISYNIATLFANYLRGNSCTPFADGVDLYLDEDNRFVPDFMVVCNPSKIKNDGVHGSPDFVVEVLSPSTANNDRGRKKEVYAQCGVREYWIVSPGDKSIEQYFLKEGRFKLEAVHSLLPDWQLEKMTEQERAEVETHFKCSLFEDLDISIEDIFYRTF